jgi:hypothetical protein
MSNRRGRPWPAETMVQAQRLYDAGELKVKEISSELGVPIGTLRKWIYDPEGIKARERKARYRGTCERCGTRTDGSCGPGKAPTVCGACFTAEQHATRQWTREAVVEAIRDWAQRHGQQPGVKVALSRKRDGLPPYSIVAREFGSWNAAIEAAGFKPVPAYSRGPLTTSLDDYERTAQMYRDGVPLDAIAREFGITAQGVQYRLRYVGEPLVRGPGGKPFLTDLEVARVKRLYAEGLSTNVIGREIGRSHTTVWRLLKREGVQLRPRGPQRKQVAA